MISFGVQVSAAVCHRLVDQSTQPVAYSNQGHPRPRPQPHSVTRPDRVSLATTRACRSASVTELPRTRLDGYAKK